MNAESKYAVNPEAADPLKELDNLDEIIVRQPVRGWEMFFELCCGWNVKNKYEVGYTAENDFKPLFYFEEDSNCLARQCLQQSRPMTIKALREKDNDASLMFTIYRPYRMQCCCLSARNSCLGRDYMRIASNTGDIIGEIEAVKNGLCTADCGYSFRILDAKGDEVCVLERDSCFVCSCFGNVDFNILIDEQDTGKAVSKTWGGALKELFTDYDNFCVQIPNELKGNRNNKLLLIATSMLLDLKFFENPKN